MGIRKTPLPFPECGRQIRKYRKQRNYSVLHVAELIGMDDKYLANIEACRQMPSIKILQRIAILFNVPIEYLLYPHPEDENEEEKAQLKAQIEGLTRDEIEIVSKFIYDMLPLLRKFKEY